MLATDMDGTIIPLDRGRERAGEIRAFRDAVESKENLVLAYVTGRHLELALEGIRQHRLPLPRYLVCDVGTSVYGRKGQRWEADPVYSGLMRAALGRQGGEAVAGALEGTPDLTPQEEEKQAAFKWSYYLPAPADHRLVAARVRRRLARRGIRAGLVFSLDSHRDLGLLDILPAGIDKAFAVNYLREQRGLFREQVLYAGDSGNDLAVFLSPCRSIVVGNTPEDVTALLRRRMRREKGLAESLFFARHPYARGVLEGARHFGVL